MDYLTVRRIHIACAAISLALFATRAAMQTRGIEWRRWRGLRVLPHLNDTMLLAAALMLAWSSGQYPIAHGWLTAKVGALLAYIVLGSWALRPGLAARRRALALAGALACFAYIVGVAITRSPLLGFAWAAPGPHSVPA